MKHFLESLIITSLILVGVYLIFALIEGESSSENDLSSEKPEQIMREAQGLLAGDYIVYDTSRVIDRDENDPTKQTVEYIFYRYLLGSDLAEEIFKKTYDGQKNKQILQTKKFSEESFSLWSYNNDGINKELIHLNGKVIGPAENNISLISPDRNWLVYTDLDDANNPSLVLKDIKEDSVQYFYNRNFFDQGYLRALKWSADSKQVYISRQDKNGNQLPGLWILSTNLRQLREISTVRENDIDIYEVYPKYNLAIGLVNAKIDSKNISQIYLVDILSESAREILYNNTYQIQNPKLSPSGKFFSYSYSGDKMEIWIASLDNPQQKQQNRIVAGSLLAWPKDNILLIDNEGKLQLYNTRAKNFITLAEKREAVIGDELISFKFLDLFTIK